MPLILFSTLTVQLYIVVCTVFLNLKKKKTDGNDRKY